MYKLLYNIILRLLPKRYLYIFVTEKPEQRRVIHITAWQSLIVIYVGLVITYDPREEFMNHCNRERVDAHHDKSSS